MSKKDHVAILFCEDVREEAGGKSSYIGVLGPEVWVSRDDSGIIYCVLLIWATEPEVTVSGEFTVKNAPEDTRLPPAFTRTMRKHAADRADRWMIQLHGKMQIRVDSEPVTLTARFAVGGATYSSSLVLEMEPEGGAATIRG
jgi:hypothetical protein